MSEQYRVDPLKYRIRFLILTILAIKPSHGYDITKKIQEVTAGAIKPSPGSIYPILHDLSEEGIVEEELVVEKGRAKKVYRLTRKGMEHLLNQLNIFYEIMNNVYVLATEARRALEDNLKGHLAGCVPKRIFESLEKIKESAEAYLKTLKEAGRICENETPVHNP